MSLSAVLKRCSTLISLLWIGVSIGVSSAQMPELGRCVERPTVIADDLSVDIFRWCVEGVIHDTSIEPFSFTAMIVGDDDTLYATRPLSGQVVAIYDTDGDFLPDTMETLAAGLTLPNGIDYYEGALYVTGGSHIYRIETDGTVSTLVDDLPSGSGFWTGGIVIHDGRMYVAIGAPCERCEYDDPDRGAILSMALDGSDRQIVATGFRNPADVEFYRGALWTLDTSPRYEQSNNHDELNLVETGGWYGYPYCYGESEVNITDDNHPCDSDINPRVLFGSSSAPTSLVSFPYEVLPGTADTLVVVLSGDPAQVDFNGFKVVMVHFDDDNQPRGISLLIPFRKSSLHQAYEPYDEAGYSARYTITLSEQGWGFYPQQPLAVAVSPRGWLYISMTGGRIIALRPLDELDNPTYNYPIWSPMNPNYTPDQQPEIQEAQED